MDFWNDCDEIDGSGYTRGGRRHGTYLIAEDGTIISGPVDCTFLDIKTETAKMSLMPGGGVGIVWDPDAPEGDIRRDALDPR